MSQTTTEPILDDFADQAIATFRAWVAINCNTEHDYIATGYPQIIFTEQIAESFLIDPAVPSNKKDYIARHIILRDYGYEIARSYVLQHCYGYNLIMVIRDLPLITQNDLEYIARNQNLFTELLLDNKQFPIVLDSKGNSIYYQKTWMTLELIFAYFVLDEIQLEELTLLLIDKKRITTKRAGQLLQLLVFLKSSGTMTSAWLNSFESIINLLSNFLRTLLQLPAELPSDWILNLI